MHLLSAHQSTNTHGPHTPCATGARPQNLPNVSGGFCPTFSEAALGSPLSESAQCLGRWPSGPDLGSAPSRMRSSQGPRSQRLTHESLRTRRLRAAAPFGQGAGTPRAGGGQKRGRRRSGQPVDRGGTRTLRAQVPSPCTGAPPALDTAEGFSAWPGEAVPKLHPVYPSASSWP